MYISIIIVGLILITLSYFQGYLKGAQNAMMASNDALMESSAMMVVQAQMSALYAASNQKSDEPFAYTVGKDKYIKVFKDRAELVSKEQYLKDQKSTNDLSSM